MRSLNQLKWAIRSSGYSVTDSKGENPKFIFLACQDGEQQNLSQVVLSLVQENDALFFEGMRGVVKRDESGIYILDGSERTALYKGTGSSRLALFPDSEDLGILLNKKVHIAGNDLPEVFNSQMQMANGAVSEVLESFPVKPEKIQGFEQALVLRREAMANALLFSDRPVKYQILGEGHLTQEWYSFFSDHSYATLAKS